MLYPSPIMLLCCPSPLRWMSSLCGWQNVSSHFLKSRVTTWHIKQTEGPWRTWCSSQDNVFPSNHWQKVRAFSFSGLGAIPSERQPSLENYEVPLMTFFSLPFQRRGIWFCLEPGRGKATLRKCQQHSFYPARWCLLLNQRNFQVYLLNHSNKSAHDLKLYDPYSDTVIFAYF